MITIWKLYKVVVMFQMLHVDSASIRTFAKFEAHLTLSYAHGKIVFRLGQDVLQEMWNHDHTSSPSHDK